MYSCPKCKSNQTSIEDNRKIHRCFACDNIFGIKVVEKHILKIKKDIDNNIMTFEDMVDDPLSNGLCAYCLETERGERASYSTPNGYFSCEGRYCERAYRRYVEELQEENRMFNDDEWDEGLFDEGESW